MKALAAVVAAAALAIGLALGFGAPGFNYLGQGPVGNPPIALAAQWDGWSAQRRPGGFRRNRSPRISSRSPVRPAPRIPRPSSRTSRSAPASPGRSWRPSARPAIPAPSPWPAPAPVTGGRSSLGPSHGPPCPASPRKGRRLPPRRRPGRRPRGLTRTSWPRSTCCDSTRPAGTRSSPGAGAGRGHREPRRGRAVPRWHPSGRRRGGPRGRARRARVPVAGGRPCTGRPGR